MFFFADTHCLEEIDADMLPEWKDKKVPEIAKYYWKMKQASHSGHPQLTQYCKCMAAQLRCHAGFLLCLRRFWLSSQGSMQDSCCVRCSGISAEVPCRILAVV